MPDNKNLLRQFLFLKNYHSRLFLCHHIPQQNRALFHPNKALVITWNYCTYGTLHLRYNIKAGLPTCIAYVICGLSKPSQFPNDSLSRRQTFNAYGDWYRSGFSPDSLFTGYTLCGISDTLCEYLIFFYYSIKFEEMQGERGKWQNA